MLLIHIWNKSIHVANQMLVALMAHVYLPTKKNRVRSTQIQTLSQVDIWQDAMLKFNGFAKPRSSN